MAYPGHCKKCGQRIVTVETKEGSGSGKWMEVTPRTYEDKHQFYNASKHELHRCDKKQAQQSMG